MAIYGQTGNQGSNQSANNLAQQEQDLIGSLNPGGTGSNPLSTTNLDALKVSGIGTLLGFAWGPVTVSQAIAGFNKLAKDAQTSIQAKVQLINLQNLMYQAGLYKGKKPKLGVLTAGEDDQAFRNMAVGAAQSGANSATYLEQQAGIAVQTGTAGSGTHIIPATRVPEKVWTPADILGAVNAATTATGSNLAQRLIGRDFSPQELQAIADTLNAGQAAITNADVQGILQQQGQDIATSQDVYGNTASALQGSAGPNISGAAQVTPQQVYQEVIAQGGTPMQAAVAGSMVTGFESNGTLNDQNPTSTASGLFQFLTTTWQGYGGGTYAPNAGSATFEQQVAIFIKATQHGFSDWAPDLGAAWGQNPTSPAAGSKVANAISQAGLGSLMATQMTASGKVDNPAPTLKQGRTDQGVDYSGKGNLYPVGSGTVVSVRTGDQGWEGGTWLAIKLDNPVDPQHSIVYYAEDLTPNVRVGQHVGPGQVIGKAFGGSHGVEIGWGDPSGAPQALTRALGSSYTEGVPTAEGSSFANWLKSGTISGAAAGGNQGTTTDVYQDPTIYQVPAQLDPTAAATYYAENTMAPTFQKNNLLKVFQQIEGSLKSNPTPNVHVQNTPVNMKPGA